MIAKISSGANFSGLSRYLHGPGRENEHAYGLEEGGQVIGGNLLCEGDRDGYRWALDMREAAAERPDIAKPVWHMSLRAAPEDPVLTDVQWRDIAQHHAETMGWADRPWVMVRHGEDHVHVVVSRVGFDGTVWTKQNDRYLAREASLHVEREFGLRSTALEQPGRKKTTTRTMQLTQGEFVAAERTGTPPSRTQVADLVRAARDHAQRLGGGRERFEAALSDVGVQWRANVAGTGRMNGYSFHLPGQVDAQGAPLYWKASDLDRSLGWGRLSKDLASRPVRVEVAPVAPRRPLERASSHAARVQHATATAHADLCQDSARKMTVQIVDNRSGSALFWKGRQRDRLKKTQQWVRNIETRAAKRAEAAHTMKTVRAAFPGAPRKAGPDALMPTSKTFRAGLREVEVARRALAQLSTDEPRRGRGLSR